MQVSILEQPAEDCWRVKLDETMIPGYIRKNLRNARYFVTYSRDGQLERLRTEPHSREGAGCLLLYHHFEQERKRLNAKKEEEEKLRAEAEEDIARRLAEGEVG